MNLNFWIAAPTLWAREDEMGIFPHSFPVFMHRRQLKKELIEKTDKIFKTPTLSGLLQLFQSFAMSIPPPVFASGAKQSSLS
jgi:hypothetical protein